MQENSRVEWESGTLHMFICIYLLVVWILSSQEGTGEHLQREKRERSRLDTGVWTRIVGWFPAQSACGFHSPWHAILPQSTSSNPPCSDFSLTISIWGQPCSDKHELSHKDFISTCIWSRNLMLVFHPVTGWFIFKREDLIWRPMVAYI